MASERILILFSIHFPYHSMEQPFLQNEIRFLNEKFDQVYLVPKSIEGDLHSIPDGIIVDESLSENLKSIPFSLKLKTLLSFSYIKECAKNKFNPRKIKYAIASRLAALSTRRWLKNFLKDKEHCSTTIYSFWLDSSAFAGVLIKNQLKGVSVVSRCHNFDLYGNEENGFYIPFQKQIVEGLDAIFPVSYDGVEFIKSNFNRAKCEPGIMGVAAPSKDNEPSTDGVLRIASCSYLIDRKRVGLLMDGLFHLAETNSDLQFSWVHIGDGPNREMLNSKIPNAPKNLKIDFKGSLKNEDVHSFYQSESVDLFVNTSTKEGTPISIMEAISYGIPILATAFGGNKEVAERGAGICLPQNPAKEEIAEGILSMLESGKIQLLRKDSKAVWDKYYNSEKNYKQFAARLEQINASAN